MIIPPSAAAAPCLLPSQTSSLTLSLSYPPSSPFSSVFHFFSLFFFFFFFSPLTLVVYLLPHYIPLAGSPAHFSPLPFFPFFPFPFPLLPLLTLPSVFREGLVPFRFFSRSRFVALSSRHAYRVFLPSAFLSIFYLFLPFFLRPYPYHETQSIIITAYKHVVSVFLHWAQ